MHILVKVLAYSSNWKTSCIYVLPGSLWLKKIGYAGTFLQSVKAILRSDSGMVQLTTCKYSNIIKPDPFLCQLNLYSHPLTDFSGVETPGHCYMNGTQQPFLSGTAWSLCYKNAEDTSTAHTGTIVKRTNWLPMEATSSSPEREKAQIFICTAQHSPHWAQNNLWIPFLL